MADRGGPANYAGISYQNQVTALYLGRMLDLTDRSHSERVVSVAVETGTAVDDISVMFADGHREFIQAKLNLRAAGDPWRALWHNLAKQMDADFHEADRLVLALGTPTKLGDILKGICTHATNSVDTADFSDRLNSEQTSRLRNIASAMSMGSPEIDYLRLLFSRLTVHVWQQDAMKRDYVPLWLPASNVPKTVLFDHLTGFVQEGASQRATFAAGPLRDRLRRAYSVNLEDPASWGSDIYRRVIKDSCRIELPGTSFVREIDNTFPWPVCRQFIGNQMRDFDDETPHSAMTYQDDKIEMSAFPREGLDRVVLTGGPGLGKSALTRALCRQLVEDELLPAVVVVTSFCDENNSLIQYLDGCVNEELGTAINWERAAETGVLVLILDGLDEVNAASRLETLEALKTFSSRYPRTAWLMTVRDAAALPLPTNATCIEVQPLDDQHIEEVFRYYRPDDEAAYETFTRLLDSRPDVQRFARIPLFLALLATAPNFGDELPKSRSDILESYLDILFRPEAYKPSSQPIVDPTELRLIAQDAATSALKGGGIGLSSSLLTESIRSCAPGMAATRVVDQLVACGVISRTGPGRFSFPFPIVQEYLASCQYSEDDIDELIAIVDAAVRRPWVQTLQFVLEALEHGDEVAEKILNGQDDAFSTKLRLLARCISNGMIVSVELRKRIAVRLAPLWRHPSYKIQKQIGELVADAFCVPLVPELKCQLTNRYLLTCGSGRVIERQENPDLTKAIFSQMLDGDIDYFFHLYELQQAVRAISEQAYALLLNRVRREDTTDKSIQAVATLITQLDGSKIPEKLIREALNDESLPLRIRVSTLSVVVDGSTPIAEPLITECLLGEDDSNLSTMVEMLLKLDEAAGRLPAYLRRTDISDSRGFEIIDAVWRSGSKAGIQTLLGESELRASFETRCLVYLAAGGDASAMYQLADRAGQLTLDTLGVVIRLLGHYRNDDIARGMADSLEGRSLSPTERVSVAVDIRIGMTSKYEMLGWHSGSLPLTPPHPGIGRFIPIVRAWSAQNDYHPEGALVLDTHLAEMGDEGAQKRLIERIVAVLDSPESTSEFDSASGHIGHALSVMNARRMSLEDALIVRIIEETGFNSKASAFSAIAAKGTKLALSQLLEYHNNIGDYHLQGILLDHIEILATRLGITIFKSNGKLHVADICSDTV